MGDVLHLHDAHEEAQGLLPWRANGTLAPEEAARVDAHLELCEVCRADLAANLALRDLYVAAPLGLPDRPANLPARMPPRWRFLRRRVSLAWALAGQAAIAAAAALVLLVRPGADEPAEEYRLLGADTAEPRGNAIVLFAPDLPQRDLLSILEDAGAQLAGGPTASGALLVRVDPARRAEALGSLRESGQVLLAEPLDPAGEP